MTYTIETRTYDNRTAWYVTNGKWTFVRDKAQRYANANVARRDYSAARKSVSGACRRNLVILPHFATA